MKEKKPAQIEEVQNIKELIYQVVQKYKDRIAFQIKLTPVTQKENVTYRSISYQELLEDVNALGTSLYQMGLKDARIAISGRNQYGWVVAHLSNLLGGMLSIPLDKDLQVEELENSLIRSKAKAFFFDEKHEEKIKMIQERNQTEVEYFICLTEKEGYLNLPSLIQQGKQLLEQGEKEFLEHEVDSYGMSILLFTSGTTSKSKAVMLSQYGIAMNIYDMLLVEHFYEDDVNIAFLPYHHIFGSTCMLVMLAAGVKTVFPDGLRYIQSNLKEYGVSVFVGVPVLVDKMYKTIEKEIERQGKTKLIAVATKISNFLLHFKIDIRRKIFRQILDALGGKIRFVISGGAPLDKRIAQKFTEFGIEMVQGYGLTETSPVLAAEDREHHKYGSIGIPLKHVTLEIADPDEKGVGEIRVKGPNVMLGYYENEEATKEVLRDGWFYTGDLAYRDPDGLIFITGRKKDMIVLKNGKKVFPEELEILINRISGVEESMVFGMPEADDPNDIKVSCKVVYQENEIKEKYGDISEEEIHQKIWEEIKKINQTLPPYKYIKGLIVTKEPLIKTTTNKVKRMEEMKLILK